MKNAKQLSRLSGLADMQQRELAQSLAIAIRKYENHCKQIDELKSYRLDYAEPLSNGALNSASAQQIVGFISNLNSVIHTLEAQTPAHTKTVRDAEAAWIISQRRAKSFSKLAEEAFAAEQQTSDSRQERNLDDTWLAQHSARN